jgi:glycine dehydrogenase subunit 1
VLVSRTVHPHTRAVLATYLGDLPADYVELPQGADGRTDAEALRRELEAARGDTACLVVQSPNVLGLIEPWSELFEQAHANVGPEGEKMPATAIGVFNPVAAAYLAPPGDCGADVAVAEGQPLGLPLQYGGPYLGLFAARRKLLRKLPGRLVGQTTDARGDRAFCLTLQTREQHIRGAKATSNICTNQGLLAMRATVHLSALGREGLPEVASQCYRKAHYAAERIGEAAGFELAYDAPFFHEFVVRCPRPAAELIRLGRERGLLIGLDAAELGVGSDRELLVSVTEKRTRDEIDRLAAFFQETGG